VAENPPYVELKNVSKWFPDPRNGDRLVAVQDISMVIPRSEAGDFVALLGPSGCGKSTILNLIAGMIPPDNGEVLISGKPVCGPSPDTATVPQAYTCFPWLTVLGNVEFGLSLQGKPKAERFKIATEYLNKVGLEDRLTARTKELSGGMQQRVAIARTLAMKPPIVLMDEPFGALDAQTRAEMQQMLLQLWTEEKNLILFVTHDITEALLLSDRIIVFSPRPAEIVQDLPVPFPRPRPPSLVREEMFVNLSQALLQLLKKTPTSGQVRVSV
jgi:NitT/TauT family transport system ATP-binding protein